ncbi:MAG TPA: hypothetical protein VNY07_04215 [Chthoniobacterales bacterium]|jgi:hypothetical protein|nr:hypothetical protein [Chthoniobacterales bacterium]
MRTKNMTTLHLRKSTSRSPLRLGFLLITLALAWFALSPTASAVTPVRDGGYPNNKTAEGDNALFFAQVFAMLRSLFFRASPEQTDSRCISLSCAVLRQKISGSVAGQGEAVGSITWQCSWLFFGIACLIKFR